jgi:hypothetical protein
MSAADHPLGIPLDAHQVRRLDRLRELAGGEVAPSWGRDVAGEWFVDVLGRRYHGDTLNGAIGEALRALEARPWLRGATV